MIDKHCNPYSLSGKTIVVAGASSGIGKECAITCSKLGARVVILGRNQERLESTFSNLAGDGHGMYSCDVTKFSGLPDLFDIILEMHGKISGLILSAGIEMTKAIRMTSIDDWQKIMDVNVFSSFEFARLFSQQKFSDTSLSIIFIASVTSIVGSISRTAYSASKGALVSGCRSLALELAPRGKRVNCVSPGVVRTEMIDEFFSRLSEEEVEKISDQHPLGIGNPMDVAYACAYLLSDASRWITGSNLIIDGGYSIH